MSGEEIANKAAPTTSISGAIVGRAPGVSVVSDVSNPGAATKVMVQSILATFEPAPAH